MTVKTTIKMDETPRKTGILAPENAENHQREKHAAKEALADWGLDTRGKQAYRETQKKDTNIPVVSRMELLTPLGRSLNTASDINSWANRAADICTSSLNVNGVLFQINDGEGQTILQHACGLFEEQIERQQQLTRWIKQTPEKDLFPNMAPKEMGASYIVPLQGSDRLRGFICLGNKVNGGAFCPEDLSFIHCFSQQMLSSLENVKIQDKMGKWGEELSRVYEELKKVYGCLERNETQTDQLVTHCTQGLVNALELHDRYMTGHSERVAHHARTLCNEIVPDEDEKRKIILAAKLHDLGKIAIPDHILRKKGKLEAEEIAEIHLHPLRSVELAKSLSFIDGELPTIKYHHEWWNGKGYPEGLKKENIPLGARLLAVCDAYDAMTSIRPYREAIGTKEALRELEEGANVQWDPEIVSYFIKSMQKTKMLPD